MVPQCKRFRRNRGYGEQDGDYHLEAQYAGSVQEGRHCGSSCVENAPQSEARQQRRTDG